jgi:pSer/pThr/pTyr-binding forkhead associated (FHA) protein
MARLRAISGPLAGQTIEVENELVIGRQDTDVTIDDLELSRRHAVVRRHANRLQVEDLGSSNGTFVDGNRIEEPTLLGGGAEIRIGATVLVVEGVLPVQSTEARERAGVDTIGPGLARQVTRVQAVPPPPPQQQEAAVSAGATSTAAPSAPAAPPPQTPIAEFRPPQRAHRGGIATRSWLAVALSFGTAIAVAVALVIFFATSG